TRPRIAARRHPRTSPLRRTSARDRNPDRGSSRSIDSPLAWLAASGERPGRDRKPNRGSSLSIDRDSRRPAQGHPPRPNRRAPSRRRGATRPWFGRERRDGAARGAASAVVLPSLDPLSTPRASAATAQHGRRERGRPSLPRPALDPYCERRDGGARGAASAVVLPFLDPL